MEYWDIYDKDRNPLGRTHLRGDRFEEELTLLATNTSKNYFQDIYMVRADVSIEAVVLRKDEAIEARWSSFEDIDKMIEGGEFVYNVGKRFEAFKGRIAEN